MAKSRRKNPSSDVGEHPTNPSEFESHRFTVTVRVGRRKWTKAFTEEAEVGAFLLQIAAELRGRAKDLPRKRGRRTLRQILAAAGDVKLHHDEDTLRFRVDESFVPFGSLQELWKDTHTKQQVRRLLEATPIRTVRRVNLGQRLLVHQGEFAAWWQARDQDKAELLDEALEAFDAIEKDKAKRAAQGRA
jgi:hypothetical protein